MKNHGRPGETPKCTRKAPIGNIQQYIDERCDQALAICDDDLRRLALAKILLKSTEKRLAVSEKAAKEIAKFLIVPLKKEKGRPFINSIQKARRVTQMDVLVTNFNLIPSRAAELVAASITTNLDKPVDPSGLRKLWKLRNDLWRLASIETGGEVREIFFRSTGFRYPDCEWFNEEEVKRLLSAKLDTELEKQLRSFFRKDDQLDSSLF